MPSYGSQYRSMTPWRRRIQRRLKKNQQPNNLLTIVQWQTAIFIRATNVPLLYLWAWRKLFGIAIVVILIVPFVAAFIVAATIVIPNVGHRTPDGMKATNVQELNMLSGGEIINSTLCRVNTILIDTKAEVISRCQTLRRDCQPNYDVGEEVLEWPRVDDQSLIRASRHFLCEEKTRVFRIGILFWIDRRPHKLVATITKTKDSYH